MTAVAEDTDLSWVTEDTKVCEARENLVQCCAEAVVLGIWSRTCCGTVDILLCERHRDIAAETDRASMGLWHCKNCGTRKSGRLLRLVPLR